MQTMQRVASFLTTGPRSSETNVRLASSMREKSAPKANARSWSWHSPPSSHTGQSSGWLTSRNSITPLRAVTASGEVVRTCMPSATYVVHAVCGLGIQVTTGVPAESSAGLPSGPRRGRPTSTTQIRQAPSGGSF